MFLEGSGGSHVIVSFSTVMLRAGGVSHPGETWIIAVCVTSIGMKPVRAMEQKRNHDGRCVLCTSVMGGIPQ